MTKTLSTVLVLASSLSAACAEEEPTEPKGSQSAALRCSREDEGRNDPRDLGECIRARVERRLAKTEGSSGRKSPRARTGEAAVSEESGTRCQMGIRCSDSECSCTAGPNDGQVCDGASTSEEESCDTKCKTCE